MRVPQLRLHANGQWYIKWGGKFHYFGKDRDEAELARLKSLESWRRWKVAKRQSKVDESGRPKILISRLIERFLDSRLDERGNDCVDFYAKHLKRFRDIYGDHDADLISPKHLQMLKATMVSKGFAPRTINHDITSVRTMLTWASGLDLVRAVNLKGVKQVPVGPVNDPSLSSSELVAAFRKAPDYLRPWFALNYLGLLRPSEVVRVVRAEGKWHPSVRGIFVLDKGKMDARSSIKRHCILSDRALAYLRIAEPRYSRLDSYSQAIRDHCEIGPKAIQKTAAARLVTRHNVPPESVELLLGHVKSRLSVTYYLPHFKRLRQLSQRLAIR